MDRIIEMAEEITFNVPWQAGDVACLGRSRSRAPQIVGPYLPPHLQSLLPTVTTPHQFVSGETVQNQSYI